MRLLWIVVLLASVLGAGPGMAQSRHALVVGMQEYSHVSPLKKAANDARAVAAALEEAGFATELVLDADQTGLLSALVGLGNRVGPGDEVVLYYAGHGVEIAGQNYLLPVDIPALGPGQELVLKSRGLALDVVLGELTGRGARVSLLIIDACRDNPFPKEGTRTVGSTRGLTRVDPPKGSFVVYSAGAGQTALDRLSDADPDPNSVFTRALLPRLREPGKSLRDMVHEVRSDVSRTAQSIRHEQFPAYYDQLDGDYVFVPAAVAPAPQPAATAAVVAAPTPEPAPAANPQAIELAFWQSVEKGGTQESFHAYLDQYPQGIFSALARERLAALTNPPTSNTTPRPQATQPAPSPDATRPSIQLPPDGFSSDAAIFAAAKRYYETAGEWAGIYTIEANRMKVTRRGANKIRVDLAYEFTCATSAKLCTGGLSGNDQRYFIIKLVNGRWVASSMGGYLSARF